MSKNLNRNRLNAGIRIPILMLKLFIEKVAAQLHSHRISNLLQRCSTGYNIYLCISECDDQRIEELVPVFLFLPRQDPVRNNDRALTFNNIGILYYNLMYNNN